jgi:hypothetical protein
MTPRGVTVVSSGRQQRGINKLVARGGRGGAPPRPPDPSGNLDLEANSSPSPYTSLSLPNVGDVVVVVVDPRGEAVLVWRVPDGEAAHPRCDGRLPFFPVGGGARLPLLRCGRRRPLPPSPPLSNVFLPL